MSDSSFRVLALDGGGMRGLYSASLLDTLNRRFSGIINVEECDIGRGFDLIVGTSTGGILACALAKGVPSRRLVDLYYNHGPLIFTDPKPAGKIQRLLWAWRNRCKAANSAEPLRAALHGFFEEDTLGSLFADRGIALCVAATHVGRQEGWVFKTPHSGRLTRDLGYQLVDVCLATSAAPIYLPLHAIDELDAPGHHVFTDGGLWANNPVLIGLIEALELSAREQPIEVVSISTCPPGVGESPGKDALCRGVLHWLIGLADTSDVINTCMDAQARAAQHMANLLAVQLNALDKQTTITRLQHSAPSATRLKEWELDATSESARRAFIDMGRQDADAIFSSITLGDTKYQILADAFRASTVERVLR